MNGARQAGEVD